MRKPDRHRTVKAYGGKAARRGPTRSTVLIGVMLVTLLAWASPAVVAGRHLSLPDAPVATAGAPVPTITAIAAGRDHTCALTSRGGVICWGYTENQLSNDPSRALPVPVDPSGLTSGVTAIAAGFNHTCALTSGGGVKCWGANDGGELGNGTTTTSIVAVDVRGLTSGVSTIAAGSWHTCALTSRGRVTCWGLNDIGLLGRSGSDRLTPVDASVPARGIIAIAAGNGHTCALTSSGGVRCWGSNSSGELGNGSTTDSLVPVDVSGLTSEVTAIAAGEFRTCALTRGGGVKCWGEDTGTQREDGSVTNSTIPVDVSGLASGITAIAVGYDHTCALTAHGGVKCWGWNGYGQLGDGSTAHSGSPVDVSGLTSGITAIAAGDGYTCALTSGGGVKCWGANFSGQLGNGTTTDSLVPVDVIVDFASQGPPPTDTADPGANEAPADIPLLPPLAGLAAGIAMVVRRRPQGGGDGRASIAAEPSSRVDARETGTAAADG